MSSENRGNLPPQVVPVYTVYPGTAGYGFHHSCPQTSPPKYEDVINGRLTSRPHGTYGLPEQGVIFVTPVKYTNTQKALGAAFVILCLVCFVGVLIKVLSVQ